MSLATTPVMGLCCSRNGQTPPQQPKQQKQLQVKSLKQPLQHQLQQPHHLQPPQPQPPPQQQQQQQQQQPQLLSNDSILKIPATAPLKPLQCSTNDCRIHWRSPAGDSLLLQHRDFPFLLRGRVVDGAAVGELEWWMSGQLTQFPFLKNVYWAWPFGDDSRSSSRWMIIEDECESILDDAGVVTVDAAHESCKADDDVDVDDVEFTNIDQVNCHSKPSLSVFQAESVLQSLSVLALQSETEAALQSVFPPVLQSISETLPSLPTHSHSLTLTLTKLLSHLAEALNHLHSSALIHGNICPASLTFHRPTASLKLTGFHHLQRIRNGAKCFALIGDVPAFRKPGCQERGYFEEVDWYSFGLLIRWLLVVGRWKLRMRLESEEMDRLDGLAKDLIDGRIGTGPAVYSAQIKPKLSISNDGRKEGPVG